jgi:acetyltransferase-like isoleucine patch superfamily enzyme
MIPRTPAASSPAASAGTVGQRPSGLVDRFIRRFNRTTHVLAILALYLLVAFVVGCALAPAIAFVAAVWPVAAAWPSPWRWLGFGTALGVALFIAGFALLVLVPLFNRVLPTRVREFHGSYFTIAAVPWYLHNGLFYLVRYTFLPYVCLTPFGLWFLRAMGMKIGERAYINTEFISDPCMITIEDEVVIGGSVHLFAHYGGGGHLTIAPVRIGRGATVGQKATVMGDVEIGEHAVILPHSVLLPGSRVGAGEIWGGVPAQPIAAADWEDIKARIA